MLTIFQLLGDLSHTTSKFILIYAFHRNQSAEGVSLLMQLLYGLVFVSRYVDLFRDALWRYWYLTFFKILYISTSIYVVYLMMKVYPRTREKERAWKLVTWSLAACTLLSPLVMLALDNRWTFVEWLWVFSIMLESVCVLPQLLLLRQTSVPTVIDSYYLFTLGVYRLFYIINWIFRYAKEGHLDWISIIFGVIQTTLYADFAWVYYSRQRVKLRGGAVVDSDDMGKSFLVRRFIGKTGNHGQDADDVADDDEALSRQENGAVPSGTNGAGNRWGARGISVSADDTLHDYQARKTVEQDNTKAGSYADVESEHDAQMMDPSHFEDEDDNDVDNPPPPPAKDAASKAVSDDEVGSSANEWQSNTSK